MMCFTNFRRSLCAFFFLLPLGLATAGPVDQVTVTAFGTAQTKQDAIKKALVQAVEQVNGVVLSSKEKTALESVAEQASASADVSVQANRADGSQKNASATALSKAKSSYARKEHSQETSTKTSGVVSSWRLLALQQQADGLIEASIEASVAVLKKSKSKRTKVVLHVSAAQTESPHMKIFSTKLQDLFSKSRKFAVLDRENDALFSQEIDRANEGGSVPRGILSKGGSDAPDLIVSMSYEAIKTDTGVEFSPRIKVLDLVSQEAIYNGSTALRINSDDPDRRVAGKIKSAAKSLHKELIEKIAQPTVLGFSGDAFTVSQGSDFFKVGESVQITAAVDEVKDPYTGERLDFVYEDLAVGKVKFVNTNISTVAVSDADIDRVFEFAEQGKKILVRSIKKKMDTQEILKSTEGFLNDL